MEAKLQSEIIKWLKGRGCYVIKTKPGMGTPRGCPDVFAFFKDRFAVIEVKASAKASYRPGQAETLAHFKAGNRFVYTAYPENWPGIKAELLAKFF